MRNTTEPSASVFKHAYPCDVHRRELICINMTRASEHFMKIIELLLCRKKGGSQKKNKRLLEADATNHSSRSTSATIGSPDC